MITDRNNGPSPPGRTPWCESEGTRYRPLLALAALALVLGCGAEERVSDATTEATVETTSSPPKAAPPLDAGQVRRILDDLQPAIPLWPGALPADDAIRHVNGDTVIDLWSDDPFSMVWHYYVLYLSQYRAWVPPDPYPPPGESDRYLELDLRKVMQDPFVPGTEFEQKDVRLILTLRENRDRDRVAIRYLIQPDR